MRCGRPFEIAVSALEDRLNGFDPEPAGGDLGQGKRIALQIDVVDEIGLKSKIIAQERRPKRRAGGQRDAGAEENRESRFPGSLQHAWGQISVERGPGKL